MKLSQVQTLFGIQLSSLYPKEEWMSFFYQLVEFYLKEPRFILHMNPEYELDHKQCDLFMEALNDLKHYKPIQYIIGQVEFMDLKLEVNSSVLIPRPETEDLIIYLDKTLKDNPLKRILDIGTGSGCIGLSLKQRVSGAVVDLMDVSTKALDVAQKNAELNNLKVSLIHANVLELNGLDHNYDLIVSNPPYVRMLEKDQMYANVLTYEPHLALFVPDEDPLLFYRKIAMLAKKQLNNGGQLFFEINEAFGEMTVTLLNSIGFKEIKLISDRFGKDRIVSARV